MHAIYKRDTHLHCAVEEDNGSSCSTTNPCQNGGACADVGDHVQCRCHGNWRGSVCNSSE